MIEYIKTNNAPSAIGPYSQGVIINDLIYTSGQICINPLDGSLNNKDIETETHQVCKNIKNILESVGSNLDKVIKTTVFIRNINDFGKINEIYGLYFKTKPARSLVEVSNLPKSVNIEIEVITSK
ncbi:MAG: Rid family detoxifying hydrolase [Acholeplasmatales bacterium]|nr:Rid family detoxifying hydrolase [Acholeplasmatales bacterium]